MLSKVILKYHASVIKHLHPEHPIIHFRIIRAVNPLSQRAINQKLWNYITVSIYHCHKGSFMNSLYCIKKRWNMSFRGTYWLSIAYLILLHVCHFFLFLFFSYFYLRSLLGYWHKYVNTCSKAVEFFRRFLRGFSKDGLLQSYLAINLTALVQFGKI